MEESVTLFRKSYDELVDIKNSVINIKKEAEEEKNVLVSFLANFILEMSNLTENLIPISGDKILKEYLDQAATNAGYSIEIISKNGMLIEIGNGKDKIKLKSNG